MVPTVMQVSDIKSILTKLLDFYLVISKMIQNNHNILQNSGFDGPSISVFLNEASEALNEWADDEVSMKAVQQMVDTLDDIVALQEPDTDKVIVRDMMSDERLVTLLQVISKLSFSSFFNFWSNFSSVHFLI